MTAAQLLLEIRRRADSAPQDVPRGAALKQAAREVLNIGGGEELDTERLEALSPEAILRLDLLPVDGAGALRAMLVRPTRNEGR
jgi:hypothetical protein